MRKRNIRISVRLSEKEYLNFQNKCNISALKMEPFIRNLIMGMDIRPRPPDEYGALLRELSAIGNNINQIARIANSDKRISPQALEEIMRMQAAIWQRIKGM